MTSKERVYRAVAYQEVDRLPASTYGTTIEYEVRMAQHLNAGSLEVMYDKLGIDIWRNRVLPVYIGDAANNVREGNPTPFADCHTVDQVEKFRFPTPEEFDTYDMTQELQAHQNFATITGTIPEGYTGGPFHLYLEMCGQENGFVFLKQQPEVAKAIIRRIMDYWCGYAKRVLDAGHKYIDIFAISSDFGTQRGLMLSAEDFREFFKPALKRLYDLAKGYGVLCMQHSCGAIEPLIPDFIELGADILNPIQTTAAGMGIWNLHEKYWDRIVFFGGLDTQFLLRRGPENKIRWKVRIMKSLFPTGCIIAPSQELAEDIPLRHAIAIFDENRNGK